MKFAQVRLLVADFPGCYRFYRDVLGLKPQFEAEGGPFAKFTPGGDVPGIALQDRVQMSQMLGELAAEPTGYRTLVVLRIDGLDRYCEEITARGAVLVHGPALMSDHMRVAYLKDPAGNLVELQEWVDHLG